MKYTKDIVSSSVDGLQVKGIKHIRKYAYRITKSKANGPAWQKTHVNYILNPAKYGTTYDRVNTWRRPTELWYLANELILYFSGSLSIHKAIKASKTWLKMADKEGKIESNYGYYVFYKKKDSSKYSQYIECRNKLLYNDESRRVVTLILNLSHNMSGPDYPCTFDIQFIVEDNKLNCIIGSRSTDVITGLPYDMGFFSFLNEMMWKDLTEHGMDISLGYVMMKANYTQIYDKSSHLADKILFQHSKGRRRPIWMPKIDSANLLMEDIKSHTSNYSVITRWCHDNKHEF